MSYFAALAGLASSSYNTQQGYNWNLENNQAMINQWHRENSYNNPSAQVQRLLNAGLNPALMYGNGGIMNEAAPSPALNPAQSQLNFDPASLTIGAQTRLLNSQAEAQDALARNYEADTAVKLSQVPINEKQLEVMNTIISKGLQEIEESKARASNYIKDNELKQKQIEDIVWHWDYNNSIFEFEKYKFNKSFGLDYKRYLLEKGLNEATIKNLNANTRKALAEAQVSEREYDEMVKTFAYRFLGIQNEAWLTGARIQEAYATARKLGLESDVLEPSAERGRTYNSNSVVGQFFLAFDYLVEKLTIGFAGRIK